jgi:Transposase DDE domain
MSVLRTSNKTAFLQQPEERLDHPYGRELPNGRQGMSHRHCIRPAQWSSVGDAAARDGLWFRHELLAAVARLATGGNLATDPLLPARLAGPLRADRLVAGSGGRQFDPGSFWGAQTGPNPTDRAKLGSKRHLICDGRGVPLAIQLTGAIVTIHSKPSQLVDPIPSLQGERGRPRHRPDWVQGDRGYDAESSRQGLRDRRIIPISCETQHRAWQRTGALALGSRTDFRLAESVPAAAAGSIRKAGGQSRGIFVLGVRSDLLALPASGLGSGLKLSVARNIH